MCECAHVHVNLHTDNGKRCWNGVCVCEGLCVYACGAGASINMCVHTKNIEPTRERHARSIHQKIQPTREKDERSGRWKSKSGANEETAKEELAKAERSIACRHSMAG